MIAVASVGLPSTPVSGRDDDDDDDDDDDAVDDGDGPPCLVVLGGGGGGPTFGVDAGDIIGEPSVLDGDCG